MLEYILDGGFLMLPLVAASVFMVAVMIDRIRAFRAADIDNFALRRKVTGLLEHNKIEEALDECQRTQGPVAAVLMTGIDKYRRLLARGRTIAEIEVNVSQTIEDYMPHAVEVLDRRMYILPLLASIGPLMGMLGTVLGMIKAFTTLSASGVDSSGVAAGISVAFLTTAAGLLIAVPSVICYNILFKKLEKVNMEMEEASMDLVNWIALHVRPN